MQKYTRFDYGALDFMRDVGGLFNAFCAIFAGLTAILNYNGLQYWLTSKLFRAQTLSEHMENSQSESSK